MSEHDGTNDVTEGADPAQESTADYFEGVRNSGPLPGFERGFDPRAEPEPSFDPDAYGYDDDDEFEEYDDDEGGLTDIESMIDAAIERQWPGATGLDLVKQEFHDQMAEEARLQAATQARDQEFTRIEHTYPELRDPEVGEQVLDVALNYLRQIGREDIASGPGMADLVEQVFRSRPAEDWLNDQIQDGVLRAGGFGNPLA
ncbi:MAG: hypothetical protein AVDCRST_MAG91-403 [uncultured Sphingomonadaceae bacterium]|uniref:Uncharacterized protein n=1 Tax=uncultured Sphingomonadaceae bacterium TaxID=169976 RepID=A0A6J4SBI9_9SPHN|nr:MAG: hypothetical protein AVDCRST_MAG91-403 [uncultured Sphingomonadaceae bacterium]